MIKWGLENFAEFFGWYQKLKEEEFESNLRDYLGKAYNKLPAKY